MATRKNKPKPTDRYGRKVLKMLRDAPALMSTDDMQESEQNFQKDTGGVARRAAMAILTRSGAELLETIKDREHALALAEFDRFISEYRQKLEALAHLIRTAETRIMVALATREDMQQIMDEAQGRQSAHH